MISLNFPLMFPPPPVDGFIVPGGMMPWRQLRLGCHPPGLRPAEGAAGVRPAPDARHGARDQGDRGLLRGRAVRPWSFIQREQASSRSAPPDPGRARRPDRSDVRRRRQAPAPLLALHRPAARPGLRRWEREMIDLASATSFARRDRRGAGRSPGRTRRSCWPRTTAGPTLDVFHVNSWLGEGYLSRAQAENGSAPGDAHRGRLRPGDPPRPRRRLGPDAYAATPSSQGINIVSRVPGTDEPLPDEARPDRRS